ncbi:MAG TPA: SNF2 helicase-associated domain-containing protein, partial [Allocoleopsis sp.]
LVWGEVWRRVEPIEQTLGNESLPVHPYAMQIEELASFLRSLHQTQQLTWTVAEFPLEALVPTVAATKGSRKRKASSSETTPPASPRWQSFPLSLPTHCWNPETADRLTLLPQLSAATDIPDFSSEEAEEAAAPTVQLKGWNIPGIWLTAPEALQLLQSLPLSSVQAEEFSWLGADLRFWSHVARWQLDLLARTKFLPGIERQTEETAIVHWQVLMDSGVDQTRLETFAQRMPAACRLYGVTPAEDADLPSPLHPQEILFSFLNHAIDAQVQTIATTQPLPTAPLPKDLPLREWLQALGSNPLFTSDTAKLDRLLSALTQWVAPFQQQLNQKLNAFRTCFYLHPPTNGKVDWTMEYFLQAANDPEFLVSARTVWQNPVEHLDYMGRVIEQPQETLLAGLGLASRLYPVIEPSLQESQPQSCQLHPLQVYEFLRSTAWRLQDSGFGVILPPSLANQEGWANRLGLRIQAETPKSGKNQRLGLQSLLNFKWELTIGGQRLSKAEFDRLVALNTPLV